MWPFKNNTLQKKRQRYDKKLEQAMMAQRNGDIKSYAMLTEEAEKMWVEIEALDKQND